MGPTDVFSLADEFGPVKVVHVHEASCGLRGILVVDNVAIGPSIGGLRMAPDVTLEECARLARAMTLKNAAAGLPHGGGKSVIVGDPAMPIEAKERMIRAFASALATEDMYIFGPDMGTNETCMAWVRDEIGGRAVGLPREIGGIPLDEIGATGFGVSHATAVAAKHLGIDMHGARVVIQGFGAVGQFAARFLSDLGCHVVAVSDTHGAIHNSGGLDVAGLIALKQGGRSVFEFGAGEVLDGEDAVGLACDIWVPAARPDVIREDNLDRLQARLVVPGANIAVTDGAELELHRRGVLCLPDFIANAGGVICASVEYHGGTQAGAIQTIEEKIRANTEAVLAVVERENRTPRDAAVSMAAERVRSAMAMRRWSSF